MYVFIYIEREGSRRKLSRKWAWRCARCVAASTIRCSCDTCVCVRERERASVCERESERVCERVLCVWEREHHQVLV